MDNNDQFLKLFLRYEADIRAFIGSLVYDPYLRDDVFQEVALVLLHRFEAYDPSHSFGAWARGIAAKKILQQREQEARFPVLFSPQTIQAILEAFDRTEDPALRKADALKECVKLLPKHSRDLLELRYERDMKAPEIARHSGRTLEAIYQALSRVRARLEECVRQRVVLDAAEA